MLDPKNMINITGGVVADPEIVNGRIAKLRIAVDYAGSEKGSQSTAGYFDLTYYLKDQDGFVSKNAQFISNQIESGKLKKGSQIAIIGRLMQERWQQDNTNRSKVVVVAEHVSWATNGSKSSDKSSTSESSSNNSTASVPEEF